MDRARWDIGEKSWNRSAVPGLNGGVGAGDRGVEIAAPLDAFEAFYRDEREWARRLAYVMVVDVEAAEDIAQESFLALQPKFATLENPRAYLRVTVVNACRRHRRRESKRRATQTLAREPEAVSPPAREMLDLIDRLPARQRAVLVLRYFEGLSEAEIATTLSCRPGTVKSLAARGLERLRKELDE